MENIKNIIFDLGGVILNIDYSLTEKAFYQLGIHDFKEIYSQLQQSQLFDLFETGKITEKDFIENLQLKTGNKIDTDLLISAWNAMLLDLPLRRLQILQQLQLHYKTFLLSNTNMIHEREFNKTLKSLTGFSSLSVFFDKVYFSHQIGLRKPDAAVFELILTENQLSPQETLFIDDSWQHIETAKSLGINTIFLEKGKSIEEDIFKRKT